MISGILCTNNVYCYKGTTFEFHPYCGPCPLTKQGDPFKRIPNKFWDLWEEFYKLPTDIQESYLVQEGGCFSI